MLPVADDLMLWLLRGVVLQTAKRYAGALWKTDDTVSLFRYLHFSFELPNFRRLELLSRRSSTKSLSVKCKEQIYECF